MTRFQWFWFCFFLLVFWPAALIIALTARKPAPAKKEARGK